MSASVHTCSPILGVLGGMGPLATADFMRKLVQSTPATRDQDHMPVFVHSVPQIPDRSESFLAGSDAPWPFLLSGLRILETAGAGAIAIPCNTAHLWHARLAAATDLEVLHIGTATSDAIAAHPAGLTRVGLMATSATIEGRIYHDALRAAGIDVMTPSARQQTDHVMAGIAAVKAGELGTATSLLQSAATRLIDDGAQAVILGCTELPLVLDGKSVGASPGESNASHDVPFFDTTQLLVKACLAWWSRSKAAQLRSESFSQ
jgi:aspartate racemase